VLGRRTRKENARSAYSTRVERLDTDPPPSYSNAKGRGNSRGGHREADKKREREEGVSQVRRLAPPLPPLAFPLRVPLPYQLVVVPLPYQLVVPTSSKTGPKAKPTDSLRPRGLEFHYAPTPM
jgi:hypothetical protein